MFEQPLLPSHPHPQFVAAKSLILKSSIDLIYSSYYVEGMSVFPQNERTLFFPESLLGIARRKKLCYSTYDCAWIERRPVGWMRKNKTEKGGQNDGKN